MLADDQLIAREGLRGILETSEEIKVIGEAATTSEATRKAAELSPQILFMDLKWFGDEAAGWMAIKEIKKTSPEIRIIALTAYENLVKDARFAGADAVLLKTFTREELIGLVEVISQTEIDMTISKTAIVTSSLSNREKDVLRLVAEGMRDNEISSRLEISPATVKNHLESIFLKLDVKNRTHAASKARELKLID